jgi:hypothetical protein
MFEGSHDAAQRATMIYSFLATCKINKIEPFNWPAWQQTGLKKRWQ